MSAARALVGPLDAQAARALTLQLRDALTLAVDLITRLVDGQAWQALGFTSWADYCAAELPELAELVRRSTVDERRAVVVALHGRGHSLRAIGGPLGLAPNTVRADLAAAGAPKRATVTSLDGRQRPAAAAPRPKAKPVPLVVRIVQLVDAHPAGLDVREVCKALRIGREQAGPALCRLAAAGRLTYAPPARRGQTGRYLPGRIAL
jgi:hypothetical protein